MKIYILTDNQVRKRGFLAEHGLSVYIEDAVGNVLFDTGQSEVYCLNAARMGVDLGKTDCVVLSHGHYDHCGGLPRFPDIGRMPKIFVNEGAFIRKYSQNSDPPACSEIGIPWTTEECSRLESRVVRVEKSMEIMPGITVHGRIPSVVGFEGVPKGFFRESPQGMAPDMIIDEQMLIIQTGQGLALFLGCSHPGVINCVDYALRLFPGRKIDILAGGMHLNTASPLRVQMTIQYLLDRGIRQVIPLHCTGILAICEMKRFLGERCTVLCAGESLELS